MKIIAAIMGFAALAAAEFDYGDWRASGEGDVRGPCPVLNALANHGFLPRDGHNITQAILIKATAAVNLSTEVAGGLFAAALKTSSGPAQGTFSLQDLKKHNIIEHDGSLSRADAGTPDGSDQAFNHAIFNEFKSFFNNATDITLQLAAAARWGRIQSARKYNPNFVYGLSQRFNSYAESSIYFQLLRNPATGTVPVKWIDVLFAEERLPAREGWTTPASINGLGTGGILLQLAMATDEKDVDLVAPLSPTIPTFSHAGALMV